MPRFIPELDLVWLYHKDEHLYCVIKKPEVTPGDEKRVRMVREGCTVLQDGRWFYWRLLKPVPYGAWAIRERWSDQLQKEPDKVVAARLNGGQLSTGSDGLALPPQFKAREDNNWAGGNPLVFPPHVTDEMLGDLLMAHLQLSEEVREGKKPEITNA